MKMLYFLSKLHSYTCASLQESSDTVTSMRFQHQHLTALFFRIPWTSIS